MRAAHRLFLFRFFVLIALGTSVALFVDYTSLDPAFCSADSGCGAVRRSSLAYLPVPGLGQVPLPLLGALTFSFLFSLSLLGNPLSMKRFIAPLSYAVALFGLVLFGVQAWMSQFCPYCLVVDFASLAVGALAFSLRGDGWEIAGFEENSQLRVVRAEQLLSEGQKVRGVWHDDSRIYTPPSPLVRPAPRDPLRMSRLTWIALSVLAVLGPWAFPRFVQTSSAPPAVSSLFVSGKINVVEFFDFQCPHCRSLGPRLTELLEPYGDRVNLVHRHIPLPHHEAARPAARLSICAEEQGRGKAVIEAILKADVLSENTSRELALAQGVEADRLAECLASERPDRRIEEDIARIQAAGFEGLPTTYIGGIRILGAASDEVYLDALRKVDQGEDLSGISPWTYWGLFALVVIGLFVLGQKKSPLDPLSAQKKS